VSAEVIVFSSFPLSSMAGLAAVLLTIEVKMTNKFNKTV